MKETNWGSISIVLLIGSVLCGVGVFLVTSGRWDGGVNDALLFVALAIWFAGLARIAQASDHHKKLAVLLRRKEKDQ